MAQPHPDVTFNVIRHWLPSVSLAEHADQQWDSIQDNPFSGVALATVPNADSDEYVTTHDPNYVIGDDSDWNCDTVNSPSTISSTSPPSNTHPIPQPPLHPPHRHTLDICRIITQNVHGLWRRQRNGDGLITPHCERDMTKLEYLIHRMRCDNIDAWLVQETWLEGDDFDTVIGGYHIFRTNSPVGDTGRAHLFRGVAIVLSPRFYQAWKHAGSSMPISTDSSSPFAGRFIGVLLKFDCRDHRRRKIKGKSLHICLVSAYHPCHDAPHEGFNDVLTSLLNKLPRNTRIIMGADINAKLGRRDCAELRSVLGPHGPDCRNTRGTNLLSTYLSHGLRVENTFFAAPSHYTFKNINDGEQSMIDIFACSHQLHCKIKNCCITLDGIESDHTAVRLDVVMTSLKHTASPELTRGKIDWNKIATDHTTARSYNAFLLTYIEPTAKIPYSDFNNLILAAGNDTALLVTSICDDWFQFSVNDLAPLIAERNSFIHTLRSARDLPPSIVNTLRDSLHRLSKNVKDRVILAKAKWASHLCAKIHDMAMNPRLAWEHIRLLTGGTTVHHKKSVTMAMKLENGRLTTNAKENMSVFGPHFERVYNNHRPVDFSILNEIPQRPTLLDIDSPITFDEVNTAINKLKNGKSPGLNGIPPKAYKAMNGTMRKRVHQYIFDFFEGHEDYNEWHLSQCVPVPKSGSLSDPNKWRGVMLMDVCSKVFSSVMNGRAFRLLDLHGTKFQFGGTPTIGCQDGLFTLKTLLNVHKNHNLPSFVAFIDLVKAYDTANHSLLLKILERYGAPPKFVAAIRTMYTNLRVVLKKN